MNTSLHGVKEDVMLKPKCAHYQDLGCSYYFNKQTLKPLSKPYFQAASRQIEEVKGQYQ